MMHSNQELVITGQLDDLKKAIRFAIQMTEGEDTFKRDNQPVHLAYFLPGGKRKVMVLGCGSMNGYTDSPHFTR